MPSSGSSATAPTVIFKRRRLLLESPEKVLLSAAVATTPHKAPKVYRLTSIPTATDEAHVEPTHSASDTPAERASDIAASPTLHKPRRRRDPTRQPTLLQHVVIERPAESHSAEGAAEHGGAEKVDSMAVRGCLEQLDAALEQVARTQEAFRALDEHLRALGIPRSTA
jgi:hypothetical protein